MLIQSTNGADELDPNVLQIVYLAHVLKGKKGHRSKECSEGDAGIVNSIVLCSSQIFHKPLEKRTSSLSYLITLAHFQLNPFGFFI